MAGGVWLLVTPAIHAQGQARTQEIPLRRCDRLPVVTVRVGKSEMSFLVDTAASSLLNSKSFSSSSGHATDVRIASWTGTTATGAREVSLPELTLGERTLRNLKLPAVDLSAIAKACGGSIDGILGVDLLEKLGLSIDLQRRVARFGAPPADPAEVSLLSEMEAAMHGCSEAFNDADKKRLADCFDRDLVLNTPWGEYRGRDNVAEYLDQHFFLLNPRVRLSMKIHDQRAVGDVVWTSYDYSMDSRDIHLAGQGMMLCHKDQDHWYILSIHDTLNGPEGQHSNR
jgi:ketosteroid isomerase-like protein